MVTAVTGLIDDLPIVYRILCQWIYLASHTLEKILKKYRGNNNILFRQPIIFEH